VGPGDVGELLRGELLRPFHVRNRIQYGTRTAHLGRAPLRRAVPRSPPPRVAAETYASEARQAVAAVRRAHGIAAPGVPNVFRWARRPDARGAWALMSAYIPDWDYNAVGVGAGVGVGVGVGVGGRQVRGRLAARRPGVASGRVGCRLHAEIRAGTPLA
jgi:hypothetical protein